MKRLAIVTALWLSAAVSGVSHAQGGPPMITDDPGTPGDGNWEINIAATGAHRASSSVAERPLLDINYGVGSRIQLKYEVPWVVARDDDGGAQSGLGNSLVGVKWRFFDAGEEGWHVSTYPQVELRNPGSHAADRGLAEEGTGVLVPLEFERVFSGFGINFEAGKEFRSRGPGSVFGGFALGHEFTEALELMAELHGERAPSEGSEVAVNLGGRFALSQGTFLLSVGRDLHNRLDERASVFAYVGWQITASAH